MMIPPVQMAINVPNSFGLIAFFSIMSDGKLSVVTAIIKLKIVPSKAPTIFAPIPRNLPIIFPLRSGGKKLWIYEITKISKQRRIVIFITSYFPLTAFAGGFITESFNKSTEFFHDVRVY